MHLQVAGIGQTLPGDIGDSWAGPGQMQLAPSPHLSLPELWLTMLCSLRATVSLFAGNWKSRYWNPIESRCCIPVGLKSIWNVCGCDDEAVEMCPALGWHGSSWLLKITPKNITLRDIFRGTLSQEKDKLLRRIKSNSLKSRWEVQFNFLFI